MVVVVVAACSSQVRAMKEAGLTIRRKGLQLFQFKYYREQQALNLPDAEMEMVVNAVVHPPNGDYETRLIASKILIKVLVDSFVHEGTKAFQTLVSITSDMLDSDDRATVLHAFNLLLNLSVHINLWEEAPLIEMDDKRDQVSPSVQHIQDVQESLFGVLREMLTVLHAKQRENDKLWSAAFNCLLFWITKDGRIDREKYVTLSNALVWL